MEFPSADDGDFKFRKGIWMNLNGNRDEKLLFRRRDGHKLYE